MPSRPLIQRAESVTGPMGLSHWACLLLLFLPSCVSIDRARQRMGETPLAPQPSGQLSVDEIEEQLAISDREQSQGLFWEAVRRLLRLEDQRFLSPEQGDRTQLSMEAAMKSACAGAERPVELERFGRRELPRRPRAIHAVRMAELLLEEQEAFDAFDELRELEFVHPTHHLRARSADLIFKAGLQLVTDRRRVLWILPVRRSDRAPEVLDYLVLRHPNHPSCDQAYDLLAQIYEGQENYEKAIARLEDLITFHGSSPYALEAELKIPELRLISRLRDDTDQPTLMRAYAEASRWYRAHAQRIGGTEGGTPLVTRCEELLLECNARLALFDLAVAEFYREVEEPQATQLHALRALGYLENVVLEKQTERARELADWAANERAQVETQANDEVELLPEVEPAADLSLEAGL